MGGFVRLRRAELSDECSVLIGPRSGLPIESLIEEVSRPNRTASLYPLPPLPDAVVHGGARACALDIRPPLLAEAADGRPRRVVTHASNTIIRGWDRWRPHGCVFIPRSFHRMMQSKQAPRGAAEPTSRPPRDRGLRTGAPLHPVHAARRTVRPYLCSPCSGTVGDPEAPRACVRGGERAQRGTGDGGKTGVDGSGPTSVHPIFPHGLIQAQALGAQGHAAAGMASVAAVQETARVWPQRAAGITAGRLRRWLRITGGGVGERQQVRASTASTTARAPPREPRHCVRTTVAPPGART